MIKNFVGRLMSAACLRRPLQVRQRSRESLFLTFDDGPQPEFTCQLLALLQRYNAKATFFLIGSQLRKHPQIAEQIVHQGHAIGNHSFHHQAFGRLSTEDQISEADSAQQLISELAPETPRMFRAPQGAWSIPLLYGLNRRGYRCVHWTLDSGDHAESDSSAIVRHVREAKVSAGDIILFHDDAPVSLHALEELLPEWVSQGFRFDCLT